MTLQFRVLITDDPSIVNYYHKTFIVQATDHRPHSQRYITLRINYNLHYTLQRHARDKHSILLGPIHKLRKNEVFDSRLDIKPRQCHDK